IPGASLKVAAVTGFGGGGAPLQIDLQGQSIAELTALGEKVLQVVKEEPGAFNADITTRIGKTEHRILIDRDKAAALGLTVPGGAGALRVSLEGDNTTVVYRENGNEYPVNIHFGDAERHNINDVNDIVVGNVIGSNGNMQSVRLADVAPNSGPSTGPTKIDR